jgi:hypothetical protein
MDAPYVMQEIRSASDASYQKSVCTIIQGKQTTLRIGSPQIPIDVGISRSFEFLIFSLLVWDSEEPERSITIDEIRNCS